MNRKIRVELKSENSVWSKSVEVLVTGHEYEVLKNYDDYEIDEYDDVWENFISRLERMYFSVDDWFVNKIEFD